MKRKILCAFLIVSMIFSFCSCGYNNEPNTIITETAATENTFQNEITEETISTETTIQEKIGTRSNPYQIGDTIELNIKPYYADIIEEYKDVSLHLALTVNQSYSIDEGIAMMKDYSVFTTIPAANITFKLTGNYEDAMYFDDIFRIDVIDENMQTEGSLLENDKHEVFDFFYTEADYTAYILHSYDSDTKTGAEAKYYTLRYVDMDGTEQCIYISATSNKKTSPLETESTIAESATETEENVVEIQLGNTFTAADSQNELELTWNSVDFDQEVHSLVEDTNPFSQYFPDQEGETYIVAKLTIKNIGGDTIGSDLFSNQRILVSFNDKYNYSLTQLDTESIVMSRFWSLSPLKSQEVYFLQSVPDEVVSLPFVIEFTIGDSETIYRYIQK